MYDRFDIGMDVFCIKEHQTLKEGRIYHINGCGNLGGRGFRFGIEDNSYNPLLLDKEDYIEYYFTENGMNEYFITKEEYKAFERNRKIEEILK